MSEMSGITSNIKAEPTYDSSVLPNTASSTTSGSTDFVKKLFQMLEDDSYKNIVKWTANGDSFVVLDTNEFTKEILPRHFKHSNFASFVRQLNKYDFHKVKISNEEKPSYEYGEDAWEFKHPDFKVNDRDSLDNIKRKGPTQKKASDSTQELGGLQTELIMLKNEHRKVLDELKIVNTKYKTVLENIVQLKSFDDRYYRSMHTLIQCLVQSGIKLPPLDFPNPSLLGMQQPTNNHNPAQPPAAILHSPTAPLPSSQGGSLDPLFPSQQPPAPPTSVVTTTTPANPPQPQYQRPPGSRFHVLLVEDDAVCIQLCRKFLVKYGCSVEVVTDGLTAISTVEKIKYDLVLMDIVMPNLDGATATSVIRSFDNTTPIIAMTGNIDDADLVTYLQHGMSDILAKPFTKEDLYLMLEKHLIKKTPMPAQALQGPPQPVLQPSTAISQSAIAQSPTILKESEDPLSKKARLQ